MTAFADVALVWAAKLALTESELAKAVDDAERARLHRERQAIRRHIWRLEEQHERCREV